MLLALYVVPYSYPHEERRKGSEVIAYVLLSAAAMIMSFSILSLVLVHSSQEEKLNYNKGNKCNEPSFVLYKRSLRCSTVLVSQRGNAGGVEEAKCDPTKEVVERNKAVASVRPRDGRNIEAINWRQAEITAYVFFVSPSPQAPGKLAQFRFALLGGGARP